MDDSAQESQIQIFSSPAKLLSVEKVKGHMTKFDHYPVDIRVSMVRSIIKNPDDFEIKDHVKALQHIVENDILNAPLGIGCEVKYTPDERKLASQQVIRHGKEYYPAAIHDAAARFIGESQ